MLPMMRTFSNAWMPSMIDDFFDMPVVRHSTPAINVTESEKNYKLDLAVPGITRDQASVHLDDEGNLMIKIEVKKQEEQKSEDGKRWLRREFSYSNYSQAFTLPEDVDRETISASVNDGILSIELPKKVKEALPASRQIEIK